ncbi:MAG: carbon-nitrogen hydrolase family protein [Hyphomicrobium sp.]
MSEPAASQTFRAALVQMCTGRDVEKNLADAERLIREAAAGGADYVQTPEVTTFMDEGRDRVLAAARPEQGNAALARFRALSRELELWLHIGSMGIRVAPDRIANRSFLIAPSGEVVARYDKIHLFDVDLPGGESYRESASYAGGSEAVLAALPWGGLGLTICYDLRFPHLYRSLAQAGARFLAIPAAFTRLTGEAHWHTLIRARAIEAQCFVFAAAQGGRHEHGRETFGHSLIVSPWGQILAEADIHPAVIIADIDARNVEEVRSRVPSLAHDRPFTVTGPSGGAGSRPEPGPRRS